MDVLEMKKNGRTELLREKIKIRANKKNNKSSQILKIELKKTKEEIRTRARKRLRNLHNCTTKSQEWLYFFKQPCNI